MRFLLCLRIVSTLATMPTGATTGQLLRSGRVGGLSREQLDRTLRHLEKEGVLIVQLVPYRPKLNKRVYTVNQEVINDLDQTVINYDTTLHQLELGQ